MQTPTSTSKWPSLPLNEWQETYQALHLWTQIIGKIKLKLTLKVNHWWNIALHLYSNGLTTDLIHYSGGCFQINFDFVKHRMDIIIEDGRRESVELKTRSVVDFYKETMSKLKSLGIEVKIWTQPVEMEYKVHFDKDDTVREYKAEYVERFWKILLETDSVMKQFRSHFMGKVSPVNFFWGSFDMAITFFSGRSAPEHPGSPNVGKQVMVEAYNRELCSFGFWPGQGLGEPAYYAYAYPEPEGYNSWNIQPPGAYYHKDIKEFIMPYEAVRSSAHPSKTLYAFMQSTFDAANTQAHWDKSLLEQKAEVA